MLISRQHSKRLCLSAVNSRPNTLTIALQYGVLLLIATAWFPAVTVAPGISVGRVVGILTFGLWSFALLCELTVGRRPLPLSRRGYCFLLVVVLLLLVALLTRTWVVDPAGWSTRFVKLLMLIAMTAVIMTTLRSEQLLNRAFNVVIVSGTAAAIFLVIEQALGISLLGREEMSTTLGTVRATAVMQGPNSAALNLLAIVPIFYLRLREEVRRTISLSLFVALVVVLAAILLTLSRSAIAVLGFAWFAILCGESRKLPYLIGSLSVLGSMAALVPEVMLTRLQRVAEFVRSSGPLESFADVSLLERWALVESGLGVFKDHPLLGVGLGQFAQESVKYGALRQSFAHNAYLEVLAELGLVGFLLFGTAMFMIVAGIGRVIHCFGAPLRANIRGLQLGLLSFLVGSLTLSSHYFEVLWVLAGLSLACHGLAQRRAVFSGQRRIGHPIRHGNRLL